MTAYYNEINPYAAQWLRNLIAAGYIADGDVDERDIRDVKADDTMGYTQCHFFAGIGGWSLALRLAGWPDDRPVWTGSCPCQPFSAAGKKQGMQDDRHLWPVWFNLIRERRPVTVFGEQVEAALTTDGSTLFRMTWKEKDTPSGRLVCLLRASAHRTSDSGCGSWPTPTTRDWKDGAESNTPIKAQLGRTVWLATWPTPKSQDGMRGGQAKRAIGTTRHGSNLNDFCQLAAWATPRANDAAKQGNVSQDKRNGLPAQVLEPGTRINRLGRLLTGFIVETANGGQLAPELSRWLMGYPAEWEHCRPTETRLSHRSRRK